MLAAADGPLEGQAVCVSGAGTVALGLAAGAYELVLEGDTGSAAVTDGYEVFAAASGTDQSRASASICSISVLLRAPTSRA